MDKKAIAFNVIVIAGISVVILTISILIFTSNLGHSNKTISDTYQYEIGKAKLEKEKEKCTAFCNSGDLDFFTERTALRPYENILGLNGIKCQDLVDDSNCKGKIKKIKKDIVNYYAS